jgi:ubiquinone/menaquinone biosynthesis C-methylase UbiE
MISKSSYAYNYLFDSVESFLTVDEFSGLLEKIGFKVELKKNNFLKIVNTVTAIKL